MPPIAWMISNRTPGASGPGDSLDRMLHFYVADKGPLRQWSRWRELGGDQFRKELVAVADAYPRINDPQRHEEQKHITLFVHGYNNNWSTAVERYAQLRDELYAGKDGLGTLVLFTWPSDGMPSNYLPDRADARGSADCLADVMSALYDWLLVKQEQGVRNAAKACRAKTSMIAHSMGNYVLQKAMQSVWTRKNQPLLVSLLNQLVMVAADVDNDLFASGERVDKSDGDAAANLCYRITALYTGRDSVLGMSAGLKHFGKRRLGRSGLDRTTPLPDNVWDVDCSSLIAKSNKNIHSACLDEQKTLKLIRQILRGVDRGVLGTMGLLP